MEDGGKASLNDYMIKTPSEALDKFKRILEDRGFALQHIKAENFNRHFLIQVTKDFRVYVFYLVYQREPFHQFSKFYGEEGEALAINSELLLKLTRKHVTRLFWCLGDGRIYFESPRYLSNLAREKNWYKELKSGEVIVNIPIKYLKMVEE